MRTMSKGRSGEKQAIRDTLHRLGMQARPAEVAAALAALGVSVSAERVRAVALEMLRQAARAERARALARAASPGARPPLRRPRKVPARRGRR
jgi:hypothetical protein